MLDHALRQMGTWRAQGLDIGVAVNLSARTLIERELPDHIEAMCHRWAVPTNRLVLEITESMVVADPARALPILARLHELGVEISVDDFGTGFSSMDYLKRLPVREVKIDRSFVTTMATDARDAAIVRCTIDLARSLGLRVVAEGVESPDVRARLTTMGCDQAQGYSYSRALPQADFAAWLTARELSELALARSGSQRGGQVGDPGDHGALGGGRRARAGDDDPVIALGGEVAHVGAGLGGVARQAHIGIDAAQAGVDERAAVARGGSVDDDGRAGRGVVGARCERGADGQRTGGGEGGEACGDISHTYEHTTYDRSVRPPRYTTKTRRAGAASPHGGLRRGCMSAIASAAHTRVTSVDVAHRAGVSQSTVSLVSGQGPRRVSAATQEKVRRVARELGYRPNVAAQALRLGSSRAVALLVPDVTNPFFARVLRGAQRAAHEAGYTVALVDTGNDRRWEEQSFEALRAGPVDGYLLFEVMPPEGLAADEQVVLIESRAPRRSSVRFDSDGGAAAAFEHLLELGHRRIGHLAADFDAPTFHLREDARRRVLSGAGLDPDALPRAQ